MAKRRIALALILLLLLPAAVSAGGLLFAPLTPLEEFDAYWFSSVSAALGKTKGSGNGSAALPESDRFIIKFKENASMQEIGNALEEVDYRQLAESKQRLFAISGGNRFLEKHKDIIEYSEPDLPRRALAVTNDPASIPSYEQTSVFDAWDIARGSSSVIVAVLDTGVDRSHEDLADASILPGYDAVSQKAGVDSDPVGHGTGVIGIIAATADNSLGIAGVAHGVTVLPVKVSSNSTTIYSSDLISGIRFAVNAGAKVINMSVGGLSSSYAEQEAINYAISKGCILVSASGNGGNLPYADQKSYPASYEGVISVASCTPDGERSLFSQYNDMVDVAAPGELITVPVVENGESVYKTDSGTSYSCALVSGIAALAASHIDEGARFGGEEFLALITETCNPSRSDELGYGVINALVIVNAVNMPIITGVTDGGTYYESVRVGFNRGTALLDGDPFDDGDAILANGKHTICVTDGENEKTVSFRLDFHPLSYDFKEFASFAYFEFTRGSAVLDGFPYRSGERITASGRHKFILTDGDERLEKEIFLQYTLPTVYGVTDGGVYNHPIDIRIVGDGTAQLDGEDVYGEVAVAQSGPHILTVRSGNGAVFKDYIFEIDFAAATAFNIDTEQAKAAVDEENGYICVYGSAIPEVCIYDVTTPEVYLHAFDVGSVYSHAFIGDELILLGDSGITVIDRKAALNGTDAITATYSPEGITHYLFVEESVFCFGGKELYSFDHELGELTHLYTFNFECEIAFYSDGLICMLAPTRDSVVRTFNTESEEIYSFAINGSIEGGGFCFGEGYLAAGKKLYDVTNGKKALEFCSYAAVKIKDGLLFAENVITEIATGEEKGHFPFLVSDIVFGENANYLFGADNSFMKIESGTDSVWAYGAAERQSNAFSAPETVNPYKTNVYYDKHLGAIDAITAENTVFALLDGRYALFSYDIDTLSENAPVYLLYEPSGLAISGEYIAVSFKNEFAVYIASLNDIANGSYVRFSTRCESVCVVGERLFAISGGRLAYYDTLKDELTITSIRANALASNGERLYLIANGNLSVYSQELALISQTAVIGEQLMVSGSVIAGDSVFDILVTAAFAHVPEGISAYHSDMYVYNGGIYELLTSRYIGSIDGHSSDIIAIGKNASVIVLDDPIMSLYFYNGSAIAEPPKIEGVEEGKTYLDSAVISYSEGIGYLDGEPFESGNATVGAGKRVFTLALPFGQSISIEFFVEARLEGIDFLLPDREMSVGESLTLRVRYLPDGASSVPVRFECVSDGLLLGEMGNITALKVGKYTVTAIAETDHGVFEAVCTITVRDDLITPKSESELRIDRENRLLLGIAPGTEKDELMSMLKNSESIDLLDSENKRVNGFVATGMKLILTDKSGNITDTLVAVVQGDSDGDGFITAYDLYILERMLRNPDFEQHFLAAADIVPNGVLHDNDYKALRNIVLRRNDSPMGTPIYNLFGQSSAQTVTHIESGDIIDIPICVSGCKYARGFSGVLNYSEGLEFVEAEFTGWDGACRDIGENRISFYAYGNNGENCNKAFMVFMNLRFRVTADVGESVSVGTEGITAAFETGARIIRFNNADLTVHEQHEGEFLIEFKNAYSFEFDKDVYSYKNIVIPYNCALADLIITQRKDQTVTVSSLVIPNSNVTTITVLLEEADGATQIYTLQVRREDEPRFDSNCRLESLKANGFTLSPSFDPNVYEYTVMVPFGTEKLELDCIAQNPTAEIIVGDTTLRGETTEITVTVISPDGEALVYTLRAMILPPQEESEPEEPIEPPIEKPDGNIPIWVIITGGAIAVVGLVALYLFFAKREEEDKQ